MKRWGRNRRTHVVVAALNLGQGELHALEDGRLDVEHVTCERLVDLDNVGLPLLEVPVDVVVKAAERLHVSASSDESESKRGDAPREE